MADVAPMPDTAVPDMTVIPPPGAAAVMLAAGADHNCFLRAGALSCWGRNASGQLGLNDMANRLSPTPVAAGTVWATVGPGIDATCGLQVDGTVWCWELGLLARPAREIPPPASSPQRWACALTGGASR